MRFDDVTFFCDEAPDIETLMLSTGTRVLQIGTRRPDGERLKVMLQLYFRSDESLIGFKDNLLSAFESRS